MQSFCNSCKNETNHKLLHEANDGYVEEGGWWENYKYQTVQCVGCNDISFRKLYNDARMESTWDYENNGDLPFEITNYPTRRKNLLELKRFHNTSILITTIYKEIIEAFNNKLFILCGGGIRAIIEGICADKGITGSPAIDKNKNPYENTSLPYKIKGLRIKGLLTSGNTDILYGLTFIGNESLHELSASTRNELMIAIGIVEHMIENIYEIEHKANNLKVQIASRKSNP